MVLFEESSYLFSQLSSLKKGFLLFGGFSYTTMKLLVTKKV